MAEDENQVSKTESPTNDKLRQMTLLIYLLQALGFLTGGLTAIAAIIINYMKREEVRGTWLESHFDWQIKTFWFGLLGGFIGMLTWVLFIGILIMLATTIWVIYRIVKGWMSFNEGKPMEVGKLI